MTKSYRDGNRVGAHRSTYAERFTWRTKLLVWIVVVIVLTAVGFFALQSLRGDFSATENPQDIVTPVTDPAEAPEETTVGILNATGDAAGADEAIDTITGHGWETGLIADAQDPVEHSTVFYQGEEFEAVAIGIADQLGIRNVVEAEDDLSGSPITISVGQDIDEIGGGD